MVDAWLPYGKSEVCVRIPARNYLGSIEPKGRSGVPDATVEIERALKEPIGTKRLSEIAKAESRVALVVDDATRAVPSHLTVPAILNELSLAGVKDTNVTVIFACGMHRPVTREEATRLIGETVLGRIKTMSHDPKSQDLINIGTTKKHGTLVLLNRAFVESDLRILTGDICFHYYAGYEGGRKSIVPGISGEETTKHNHALLLDPNARAGVLDGNPVHEDMVEAAKMANVDFVLNVVVNSRREVVKAFAGDLEQVFSEGVKVVDEIYRIAVDRRADIVVVSPGGDPADVNLCQAYKGVDSALEIVKRGGVIVLVAELPEGHGSQEFYDWMAKFKDLKSVEREIKRNFIIGGHKAYYYMRAFQKARLILVSSMPDYYADSIFGLKTARAVNDALNEAFKTVGSNAKVWVMPYGNHTLAEVRAEEETSISVATS